MRACQSAIVEELRGEAKQEEYVWLVRAQMMHVEARVSVGFGMEGGMSLEDGLEQW
jgi:hypothetical protein